MVSLSTQQGCDKQCEHRMRLANKQDERVRNGAKLFSIAASSDERESACLTGCDFHRAMSDTQGIQKFVHVGESRLNGSVRGEW